MDYPIKLDLNSEIDTLNGIYDIAADVDLPMDDALQIIKDIVEMRLEKFGMFPNSNDPNEDKGGA